MEVPGKMWSGENMIQCNLCECDDKITQANGFCEECDEYMCNACFDRHKRRKMCRHHVLKELNEAQSLQKNQGNDELEKCTHHFNEFIKFYCEQHEEFGCGDCMIYKHKMCKVEYIREKANTFKESQDFKDLVKGAEKSHNEAKEMLSSIRNNKIQVVDINKTFTQEVNIFKEEIISQVTKLADVMLKQGEDVKATDMKRLDKLEKDHEIWVNEISSLTEMFESKIDQPQKLFVSSILQKPKLHQLRGQLEHLKGENKIEVYEFKRDVSLDRSVKDGKQLGSLQRIKPRNETDEHEEVRPKKTSQIAQAPVPPKPQPLLDRQLICRNMTVDGEYLSYADNGSGGVGLYVDQTEMYRGRYFEVEILSMGHRGTIDNGSGGVGLYVDQTEMYRGRYFEVEILNMGHRGTIDNGSGDVGLYADKYSVRLRTYFEVEILSMGQRGTIATGLVPRDDPDNQQPEWENGSIGYHADDGRLYNESGSGVRFGPKCNAGDRIGCGVIDYYGICNLVVFTRNRKRIGDKRLFRGYKFPAVGMHFAGEKVKVILDAEMPEM